MAVGLPVSLRQRAHPRIDLMTRGTARDGDPTWP